MEGLCPKIDFWNHLIASEYGVCFDRIFIFYQSM